MGDWGEESVAAFLAGKGCRILARQWTCRWGEIDIIALTARQVLCFVEVKTRRSARFSRPCEAVTPAKQRKIRTAAQAYLAEKGFDYPCRFDVAEVYGDIRPQIHYIPGAF